MIIIIVIDIPNNSGRDVKFNFSQKSRACHQLSQIMIEAK